MNLFRLAADLLHLSSILILLAKIIKTKSCAGISFKSQLLYLIVFLTRYANIFTSYISLYNTVMKIVFISATAYTIYLMKTSLKTTYDSALDTFRIEFLLVGAAIFALVFPDASTVFGVLWSFSIYLEAVAIMPQLFQTQRTGEADTITAHYIFALGGYRALYLLNWVYRYNMENYVDWVAWLAGIVQTLLYADFFYIYFTRVLKGKKFKLPSINLNKDTFLAHYGIESYSLNSWGAPNFDNADSDVLQDIDFKEKFDYAKQSVQNADNDLENSPNDINALNNQNDNISGSGNQKLDSPDIGASDNIQPKMFYVPVYKDVDPLGLKNSIVSTLSDNKDTLDSSDLSHRGKYFVTHKQFSPTDFLTTIHKDASYTELIHGAKALRLAMSHRSEALKVLVKNNFGRFVEAKNKIDLLYEEMKNHSFGEDDEFGTNKFQNAIKKCTDNAEKIYNPIISRRNKADKIRSTLSVVGRYKFFFNLPHSLIELTRMGKFDAAVREYKKGKGLLRQLKFNSGEVGTDLRQATALDFIVDKVWDEVQNSLIELRSSLYLHLSQSYRPLDTQEVVIRHLYDLEVEPEEDPVGFYLKKQYSWISEQMEEVYQTLLKKQKNLSLSIKPILDSSSSEDSIETKINRRAEELKRALHSQGISDYNSDSTVRDEAFAQWRLIFNAIKGISTTIVRCVPDFWRLAESYIDNKYSSDSETARDTSKKDLALTLVENLILKYCCYLFKILFNHAGNADTDSNQDKLKPSARKNSHDTILSIPLKNILLPDFENSAPESELNQIDSLSKPSTNKLANLAPNIQMNLPQTHTLLTGYFMTGIVETIVGSANDISALKISQQSCHILRILVSQLKSGLLYVLCEYWDTDSKTFHLQETWKLRYGTEHWPQFYIPRRRQQTTSNNKISNSDSSSATSVDQATENAAKTLANTDIVPLYLRAQQSILGTIEAICSASSVAPNFSTTYVPSPEFLNADKASSRLCALAYNKTSKVFFDSINSFLDSLHFLAMHGTVDKRINTNSNFISGGSSSGLLISNEGFKSQRSVIEVGSHLKENFCVLATLCNMQAFRMLVIPDLIHSKTVKSILSINLANYVPNLEKLFRKLDELVFGQYAWQKSEYLGVIIKRGILMGGFNWANTQDDVKDILPYVNKALLYLVFVHAEILDLVSDTESSSMQFSKQGSINDFSKGKRNLSQQPLIKRVFQTLYADMLMSLTRSFRTVDSFSNKGLIQATLELLFISQTLSNYSSPATDECYRLLFGYLSQSYSKSLNKTGSKSNQSVLSNSGSQISIDSSLQSKNSNEHDRYQKSSNNTLGLAADCQDEPVGPPDAFSIANPIKLLPRDWELISGLLRKCTRHTSIQFRCFRF
ncbi:ER lumen protein-retaining receptor [Smittium culicis]|uniref:ER lumen protein-retaining receptor n=1 Tax=Smittium culicis TaxID=133412 RepID=A0A1R1XZN6_9FUNG|nr:ER lumen protein-retaining receptor [Smittium culicis]